MRIAFNAILGRRKPQTIGAGRRGRHPLPRAPRDPTGRQEGEPPTFDAFPTQTPPPTARPMGTDHGRRADGQGEEGGDDRRDGGLPCGFSRGTMKTEQGTAKNDAGGYQSRDLHPQRASRHVTHDACPQPDAPERALAPSIASAMRPSACNACRALDEDVASLRGCEGAARRP